MMSVPATTSERSSHHQALQAMRRCGGCHHSLKVPHSCGHRSCPHCQHKGSQRWIERQQAKLLPVEYFLITFTVPAELRALFWIKQRICYDLLLKTAWQTVDSFARRDPRLKGVTGAHAVLHTHSRRQPSPSAPDCACWCHPRNLAVEREEFHG
jgi:hypothetical protein